MDRENLHEICLEPQIWESLPLTTRTYFIERANFKLDRHCGVICLKFQHAIDVARLVEHLAAEKEGCLFDIVIIKR